MRFVKRTTVTNDGEIAEKTVYDLDQEQIGNEAMYDGFYAVVTNLEFVRREDRIKAHFMTCYISLIVYRLLEKTVGGGFTCDQVFDFRTDYEIITKTSMRTIIKNKKILKNTKK